MAVVVSARGLETEARDFPAFETLAAGELAGAGLEVDFPNDRDPAELVPWFDRLALVRVRFPAMGDGRGFSIGARLRELGYAGRLRAAGPLIADQFAAARRMGIAPSVYTARRSNTSTLGACFSTTASTSCTLDWRAMTFCE